MLLVALLAAGIVAGYLTGRAGYENAAGVVDRIMEAVVILIVFFVGVEGGRILSGAGGSLIEVLYAILLLLASAMAASLAAAIAAHKLGWLCK